MYIEEEDDMVKKEKVESVPEQKEEPKKVSHSKTMEYLTEREIALDFATKVYKEFDKVVKSIILFGSTAKKVSTPTSDIDIIIIIDDVAIQWDAELITWYREELAKIIKTNPYQKSLHINTVKLSTWWQDLMKGDPIIINVLRYGDALIDFGGFFNPLKILLRDGKIKSTPEAIYTLLQRAPTHLARTRTSLLAAVDGLYWTMVDSAHAALIAANTMPPSPEHIPEILTQTFVNRKILKSKYVDYYAELHEIAKEIIHGKRVYVKGSEIDDWIKKTDDFLGEMSKLVDELTKE